MLYGAPAGPLDACPTALAKTPHCSLFGALSFLLQFTDSNRCRSSLMNAQARANWLGKLNLNGTDWLSADGRHESAGQISLDREMRLSDNKTTSLSGPKSAAGSSLADCELRVSLFAFASVRLRLLWPTAGERVVVRLQLAARSSVSEIVRSAQLSLPFLRPTSPNCARPPRAAE